MGYHQQRYSRLNQINKNTVKRLVPVWNLSLDNQWGEQAQPLVYNGVMFVTNARHTVAIDVNTGKQIWRHTLDWPPETPRVVCCGVSNKGPAIYTASVPRDARRPRDRARPEDRQGNLEIESRRMEGRLLHDLGAPNCERRADHRHVGRRVRHPRLYRWLGSGNRQAPLAHLHHPCTRRERQRDWPQDNDAWKVGGGSSWITGSYDPELDLTYWGTGNPAPWASQSRAGDNLYTSSVLALRPRTGEIVWHYQFTPNDPYDFDANWELINADITVEGKPRKVLMQFNRNGFLYVIDRTNGQLISAKTYEKVNWATHVDIETGRPIETDVGKRVRAMELVEMWPSTRGAKNWPHAAYNPETGLLYANTMHRGGIYRHIETKPHQLGQRYQFIENKPAPIDPPGGPIAHVEAIEPLTANKRWRTPLLPPHWSAILATGGGLLFTGKETGEFIAIDADTGKTVWQFQTGSGVNAQPITYTHKGQQYVTILSGIGGLWWNAARQQLRNVPQGGSVWTFALI